MASEAGPSDSLPSIESLSNLRSRQISLLVPLLLGLNSGPLLQDSADPSEESRNLDRIILINPFTQGILVVERNNGSDGSRSSSDDLDSWLREILLSKKGQPPASKESIEALKSVEIVNKEKHGEECVICLEEWGDGEVVKEMPCNHIFHGGCIENWLKMHGSCPVCRHKMPVDEDDGSTGKSSGDDDGERRRGIWMSFSFSSDGRSEENRGTSYSSTVGQEVDDSR